MDKTQPNSRTLIGLVIGAIVLVAGLLLISNQGGGGANDTPQATQTRVSLQVTATPTSEASPTPGGQRRETIEDPDSDGVLGDLDLCPDVAGTFDGCPDGDNDGVGDHKDTCPAEGDLGFGVDSVGCPNRDSDNDGLPDNIDQCDAEGDLGYGLQDNGCPNPAPAPVDTDNDGVPDDVDECDAEGDLGAGVQPNGCPNPVAIVPNEALAIVPYRFENMSGVICSVIIANVGDGNPAEFGRADGLTPDGNGVIAGEISIILGENDTPEAQIACVPDSAPAVMPYRFEGMGGMACTVTIANVGDANPAVLGEATGLVADENGVIAGEIGIVLGPNDTPEAQIGCVPLEGPLVSATATMSETIDVPANANCVVIITDVDNNTVATFNVVPDSNNQFTYTYEYDPGVVISPVSNLACVPNSAPAVMPYRFENMGGAICTVTIVNVGDADPVVLGEATGLVADDNGVIEGAIGIVLGPNDTPETQIACVPIEVALPPAIAAISYDFPDIPPGASCTVAFYDGETLIQEIAGVPNENNAISGYFEYDPGVVQNPHVEIGCAFVPPNAPAVMMFSFEGIPPEAVCTVQIINIGEGKENAVLGEATNLVADSNGVVAGEIGILLGAGDVPEAQIVCEAVSLPPAIAGIPYYFDGIPASATCKISILDEADTLIEEFDVTQDENGVISGFYSYDPGVVNNPRAELACGLVPDVAPAMIGYRFEGNPPDAICDITVINIGEGKENAILGSQTGLTPDANGVIEGYIGILLGAGDVPDVQIGCYQVGLPPAIAIFTYILEGLPSDAEVCGVVIYDENGVEVATISDKLPDANGVITGEYVYDPGLVSNPFAQAYCAVPSIGQAPEETPLAAIAPDYSMTVSMVLCQTIVDVNSIDIMLEVSANAPLAYTANFTSGDYTEGPTTVVRNPDLSTFYFRYPLGTGMTSGTLNLVAYPDGAYQWVFDADCAGVAPEETPEGTPDAELTPEGTPEAELTPEGTPDAELTPEGTPEVLDYEIIANPYCGEVAGVGRFGAFELLFSDGSPTEFMAEANAGGLITSDTMTVAGNVWIVQYIIGEESGLVTLKLTDSENNVWEFSVDCDTQPTYYAVNVYKEWNAYKGVSAGGLNAPAVGPSVNPTENYDDLLVLTSSIGTMTCDWDGTAQQLVCSATHSVENLPTYGGMPVLWVPEGEQYTVTENVPAGWENVYGLEWWEQCRNSYTSEYGFRMCDHFVGNAPALPSVYLVDFTKYFAPPGGSEAVAGGLNAPVNGSNYGPDVVIENLITATSSLGRAECDWLNTYLSCEYFANIGENGAEILVNELVVPEGESYTVTEAPLGEGWVPVLGVGTFDYDQCRFSNFRTGNNYEGFYVMGYCEHVVVNAIPNTEAWMTVDIDKEWYADFQGEGLGAPAEGGYQFAPTFDIPAMIVVTSDYGTLTCDWYGAYGGDLECIVQLTSRPEWFEDYDELPVGPGGTFTVVENVPDGWRTISGVGTFNIDTCTDTYTYTQHYFDAEGVEQEIELTECDHDVVNIQDEVALDGYYGVRIEKVWQELQDTAQLGGLNSPLQGSAVPGPNQSYYPLIRVTSSVGEGLCSWNYWNWNGESGYLDCWYEHYQNAPIKPYNFLLVPRGESYTVTEVAVTGYINIGGLGSFNESNCLFNAPVGYGYEGYDYNIPICYHTVINEAVEDEGGYYRVQLEKYWTYYYEGNGGLGAPAEGYKEGPLFSVYGFLTAESSLGTATCDWIFNDYYGDGNLVCSYTTKEGQTMPDNTGLWVPDGEGYTVSENPPAGWTPVEGIGSFSAETCTYFNGDVCYHRVVNFAETPSVYLLFVGKAWENYTCGDDFEDDCYEDCSYYDDCGKSNIGGVSAPALGGYYGFETPGPDFLIRNLVTVTSDLGSMSCDWVPQYYDSYYRITIGSLVCRVTSMAEGYPTFPFALLASAGSTYTVTENVPEGYYNIFGTGTFNLDETCEYGSGPKGEAAITVGEYYEIGAECFHWVVNGLQEIEPTPEVTPTEEPTIEVTPTAEPTGEVTTTPEASETPTEIVTEVVTDVPTEEPTADCGTYTVDADGFPIINLSNAGCGGDTEGLPINFSPIETGGAVCLPEALYHSNGGGTWDIWLTGDGIEAENLTNGAEGIISMAPSRSPNGRYVVYASNADGDWELYLIDLNNRDAQPMQLTNNDRAIDLDPVFSPSGRFVAYESNVDGNWEIRVIDLTTGEKARITRHAANDINPFWHPDGDIIAFQSDRTGTWQIFEAENLGGADNIRLVSDGLGDDYDPTYNPEGDKIAFRSERDGEMGIYIMNRDGSMVQKISLGGYTASTPVWSSDNRYVAYQASKAGEAFNDIFVFDTLTGETRQVTSSVGEMANIQDVAPTWLCNSLTLIFASDVSGNNRLYVVPALPMDAPPYDLTGAPTWTDNDFNNRDPQNTPSEENGSRMGALPPRANP